MPELLAAVNDLFNNKQARKTFLKLRLPLGLILFVAILFLTNPVWFFPGLIVSIAGELLQVWCFSTIKTKKKLTVTGPYMFVRNPMYIGRFFLVFGIIMMTGSIWLMLASAVIYYFYMVNRVRREEKLLFELFGEDYAAYCREVPPYLPTMKRFDATMLWSFNRESFAQNNALRNLLAVSAGYFVLYVFTFVCPL